MTTAGEGLDAFCEARTTDAVDARYACQTLLGRDAESRAMRLSKAGRPLPDLIGGFLHAQEFADHVLRPLLAGERVKSGRFAGAPSRRLRAWVAERLLNDPAAEDRARGAVDWTGLFLAMFGQGALSHALDEHYGPGRAAAFCDALLLRSDGMASDSTPTPQHDASPQRMTIALVAVAGPEHAAADLFNTVTGLFAQTYPYWTLVVVDSARRSDVTLALDACAALDARIRIDTASVHDDPLDAALDLVQGDYVAFAEWTMRLTPDRLAALARIAIVHDRPEVVIAGEGETGLTAICADAAMRVGSADHGRPAEAWRDLAARIAASGGRSIRVALGDEIKLKPAHGD